MESHTLMDGKIHLAVAKAGVLGDTLCSLADEIMAERPASRASRSR